MLLGIDVGGTFTDAVILQDKKIIAKAKKHTTHEDIAKGLLAALDAVVTQCPTTGNIKRVAISNTLITNAVTAGKLPETAVCVIPGPGYNCEQAFPVTPVILNGYTDHRGKLVAQADIEEELSKIKTSSPVALSAKFSVRNPKSELALAAKLALHGNTTIVTGHSMSGQLGFIRRTNSAYYTAATAGLFKAFLETVKAGLKKHSINAPLYILKADGGTMPAQWAQEHTVEAFFTGPAASVMGIKALLNPGKKCVSLDIGGTTTDIAFWENTLPLYAKRGAKINGYPTSVRAIHLRSIGIGGDSVVRRDNADITIGPERLGPAMALGGSNPTLTDAFLTLGYDNFGDKTKAEQAMSLLSKTNETVFETAQKILAKACTRIIKEIQDMIEEYALQPVYRVEDVVNEKKFMPELIIGVGGATPGIVPKLAELASLPYEIPPDAFVANAVGAAVAKPTIMADLRADTALGECILPQSGQHSKIDRNFSTADAKKLLSGWLEKEAQRLAVDFSGTQIVWLEEFPVIRDSYRSGNIINLSMQLEPGVLFSVKGDAE